MSDLVERLREGEPCNYSNDRCKVRNAESACLCAVAADEITRLRAEMERLEKLFEAGGKACTVIGAEAARLRATNDALKSQVKTMVDNAAKAATLRAENERLTDALTMLLSQLSGAKKLTRNELAAMQRARAAITGESNE